MNFQIFKLDLGKAEEPETKLTTFSGSYKKQENSRKTSTFASLTTLKPLTVWITTVDPQTVENSSRDRNIRPSYLYLEKPVSRPRSNSWNWTWNNRLVPNCERSLSGLYIVTLLSTSCKILG